MATLADIVITVSTVITAAFLLYFSWNLLHHRRDRIAVISFCVSSFLFLALFIRLLAISSPNYMFMSDLFLLATVIVVFALTAHLKHHGHIPHADGHRETLHILNRRAAGFKDFQSFRFFDKNMPKSSIVPKHFKLKTVPESKQKSKW